VNTYWRYSLSCYLVCLRSQFYCGLARHGSCSFYKI